MAARFAAACGLQGESAEYFAQLVEFNQARTRRQAQRELRAAVGVPALPVGAEARGRAGRVSLDVVPAGDPRAGVEPGFREDPEWIASALRAADQAERSQARARRAARARLARARSARAPAPVRAVVSTGPETRSMNIGNYHAEMMRRATAAIELVPAAERDISSLTMCLGDEGLAQLKQRIQEFRRELIEIAEAEARPSQIVQLNFQLFPLSKPTAQKRRKGTTTVRGGSECVVTCSLASQCSAARGLLRCSTRGRPEGQHRDRQSAGDRQQRGGAGREQGRGAHHGRQGRGHAGWQRRSRHAT